MLTAGTILKIRIEHDGSLKLVGTESFDSNYGVAAVPLKLPPYVPSKAPESPRKVTEEDVRRAFMDSVYRVGKGPTMAVLAATGLARISQCPPDRYEELETLFSQQVKNDATT